MLRAASPQEHGFADVELWSSQATLDRIEERSWLSKRTLSVLEKSYFHRAMWQRNSLGTLARKSSCDLLFVPGGSFATEFRPVVTMNRNLLPFEWRELRRFGFSRTFLRLLLLRWSQTRSILKADGTIFLTRYAQDVVLKKIGVPFGDTVNIPHGIDTRFFQQPRVQRLLADCTEDQPLRLVYISIVNTYKHQWHVAEAVAKMRGEGLPVALDLIGPAYLPALRRLERTLRRVDPAGSFIRYLGAAKHADLQKSYREADVAIFASTCEAFGQILTEYMAAGLPIACSNKSAMSELLGDACVYFDPEQPNDIAKVLREFVVSPELRTEKAKASYHIAHKFSWGQCASDTFAFLSSVAHGSAR